MKNLRDTSVKQRTFKQGLILVIALSTSLHSGNFFILLVALVLCFCVNPDFKIRFKKSVFKLDGWKFDENFKNGTILINSKISKPRGQHLGACFVQSLELYKQMLAKNFNPSGFFINLKENSFIDEDFRAKNQVLFEKYHEERKNIMIFTDEKTHLLENCKIVASFQISLFERLYGLKFDFEIFENIARLRAFLSHEKFLNTAFFCSIYGKKDHHINLLYKDEKGLLSINTAQGISTLPFEYIGEETSDKQALDIIAKNYINDPEDEALAFILYYPYVLEKDLSEAYKIIHS